MSAAPRVSIVMPTYNGARYLAAAVKSCLRQSFDDFELIVVIDGSTDETDTILAGFTDPRLRILRHETNRGLPAALNTGLGAACGALLSWTSDDNLYHPRAIEILAGRMPAGFDLIYADNWYIDERGRVTGRTYLPPPKECHARRHAFGACFLFTRELWEGTGRYDESLQGAEDFDFWFRAFPHYRFTKLNRVLYFARRHGRSLTATIPGEIRAKTDAVCRRHLPLFDLQCRAREAGVSPDDLVLIGVPSQPLDESDRRDLAAQLATGNAVAVVVESILPPLRFDDPPTIDTFVPGTVLAVTKSVAECIGVETPEAAFDAVCQGGGNVGLWWNNRTAGRLSISAALHLGTALNTRSQFFRRDRALALGRAAWRALAPGVFALWIATLAAYARRRLAGYLVRLKCTVK